jgi:transcriptional regulator with XRE-family HTH domain
MTHRDGRTGYTVSLVRDRVRRKRAAQGLSLRQLAAVLGVSFNTVTRFENGRGVNAETFLALAEWAGYTLRLDRRRSA